jgi:hypothetical protein
VISGALSSALFEITEKVPLCGCFVCAFWFAGCQIEEG